jgi:hypothetical protein
VQADVVTSQTFPRKGLRELMGIAEKVYELVKDLPESQAAEVLDFAEHVKACTVLVIPAQRHVDLEVFRPHRGRYDGRTIVREELYDRAGFR